MLYLGSDHAGYAIKEDIKAHLDGKGVVYEDLGCYSLNSVDYPDFAALVARSVADEAGASGILVCGTGIGVSIAANKIKGIRAALCHTEFEAEMCRMHNDANIMCVGSRVTGPGVILMLVDRFLNTAFEGGRHAARVTKMMALES